MVEDVSGEEMPLFQDALFRQKRKKGKYREVAAPVLEAPVADTHAHIQILPDPTLALAQCIVHNVGFVCTIIDIIEDDMAVFDSLETWQDDALSRARDLVAASGVGSVTTADETRDLAATNSMGSVTAVDKTRGFVAANGAGSVTEADGVQKFHAPDVRIAVGCHPHNAKHYDDALEQNLRARLSDPRVAAVGEIGLDYHYDFSPRDSQREVFRRQIRLAHEFELPVALHVREAHDEAFALLQEEGFPPAGVLLHCFNLDWETLKPWVEAGCYVAFGGALTFKRSDATRDAAARVPLDRLLTETDAPYMTPEPMRGMPCRPDHTLFTAACLAEVCGRAPGDERRAFLQQLMQNARDLLDRPATPQQRISSQEETTEGE